MMYKEVLTVTNIRPSSDLRNQYNEISEFSHNFPEPIFITKNATCYLVVMSHAEYERLSGRQERRRLLDEGLAAVKAGQSRPAEDVFAELERRFQLGGK